LDALGTDYRSYLENTKEIMPYPLPIHKDLIELLKKYYIVGGMPEAVQCYARTKDFNEVREIQNEILNSYQLDFAKHAEKSDIPKLTHIWDYIPVQLSRENKKFIFSAIKPSARAREYEDALSWLSDVGLIYKAYLAKTIKHPLAGYIDTSAFKIYYLDVGLLAAKAHIQQDILVQGNALFSEYNGAFVENYIASHLKSMEVDLYYWKNENATAEIDFVYEHRSGIYPLEVKSGINPKSKSIYSFQEKFNPSLNVRTTLLNLKKDGAFLNIPLYLILKLRDILESKD
jgi:predicted AAA+ superfamily ATPase